MKTKTLFISLLILSSSVIVFSQAQTETKQINRRNQIGIQLNPHLDQNIFDFTIMNTVSAIRYGYKVTKNITTGAEFSCNFPVNIGSSSQTFHFFNYFSYAIGLYGRYSIMDEKRFQIFAEASPYISHYSREWTSSSDHSAFRVTKFGYYVAPGVTLYSKTRKISFDLYYKFSNLSMVNSRHSELSFKVNYNF
jgi:hypothetical protein